MLGLIHKRILNSNFKRLIRSDLFLHPPQSSEYFRSQSTWIRLFKLGARRKIQFDLENWAGSILLEQKPEQKEGQRESESAGPWTSDAQHSGQEEK